MVSTIGRWGIGDILLEKLEKNFKIVSEEKPVLNSYHYFFVLEKR